MVAYDEDLADRIREVIGAEPNLTEKRMFGGLAFLIGGNMAVAAGDGDIMVRVGRDLADELVGSGDAELVEMGGRRMRGWLDVAPERLRTRKQVARWVGLGVEYARTLPPK